MEGVRFRETPEQAKARHYNNIKWKLNNGRPLNEFDYSLLRERQQVACDDLAAKIMG